MTDQAIPERLRQAMRLRSRVLQTLLLVTQHGLDASIPRVVDLAKRLADIDRLIQRREWLARVEGFDPIAMGC